jgi:hypothetical protein
MSTRWPAASSPWSNSPCQALSPASGMAALATWSSVRGFGASSAAGTSV